MTIYTITATFVFVGMLLSLFNAEIRNDVFDYTDHRTLFSDAIAIIAYITTAAVVAFLWIALIPISIIAYFVYQMRKPHGNAVRLKS